MKRGPDGVIVPGSDGDDDDPPIAPPITTPTHPVVTTPVVVVEPRTPTPGKHVVHGQDGTLPDDDGAPEVPQPELPPVGAQVFAGTLHVGQGRTTLVAGGVVVEVLLAEADPDELAIDRERQTTARTLAGLDGRRVSLSGSQHGARILGARLARTAVRVEPLAERGLAKRFETAGKLLDRISAPLRATAGVREVRLGYHFADGWITREPAIVVSVRDDAVPDLRAFAAEAQQAGVAFDVVEVPVDALAIARESGAIRSEPLATPDRLRRAGNESGELWLREAVRRGDYEPPAGLELAPVRGPIKLVLHVSPDAGWDNLEPFLDRAISRMTIGMYDFTAPHIVDVMSRRLRQQGKLRLVLDHGESLGEGTKADDLEEERVLKRFRRNMGDRFEFAWAATGKGGLFASAYHIKVVVIDGKRMWLSSGNWQSSNQPRLSDAEREPDEWAQTLRRYNREWHVIADSRGLARTFEQYLDSDFERSSELEESARESISIEYLPQDDVPDEPTWREAGQPVEQFDPLVLKIAADDHAEVMPLLSPDNFAEELEALVESAEHKLYFQNQSFNILVENERKFDRILRILRDKSNDPDIDVRIVFRLFMASDARARLEAMQEYGFDMSRVRVQSNCHTKGVVVDSKVVLVGSHNFTNEGVLYNRDASLIIRDARAARYYERIFLHDWDRLARARV